MPSFGRQTPIPQMGAELEVLAHYNGALFKPGGVTMDWSTVTAPVAIQTLKDGVVIPVGSKALRYGQVLCRITASGKYGPYDTTASDGRQTLARGSCYILNQTVAQNNLVVGLPSGASDHPPGVFDAGTAWQARLIIGAATNELGPAGPTVSAFEAAFPQVRYASVTL